MNEIRLEQQNKRHEDIQDFWERIDSNLPATLWGTNFKIPYNPIAVRQLVTRAEFARETTPETARHSFVGKKVNRKYFQHSLSKKEYVVIKSNRGNSPQLFFSYPGEGKIGKTLSPNLSMFFKPEDMVLSQKSRRGELMDDERTVIISRIAQGTNLKGREDQLLYNLENTTNGPGIECILREEAWKDDVNPFDYATRGFLMKRGVEDSPIILFCKVQSRKLNNDTMFFAVEYRGGRPVNIITRKVPLSELPVFEEILRENPETLFVTLSSSETSVNLSQGLAMEGVTMHFPRFINLEDTADFFKLHLSIKFVGAMFPESNLAIDGDQEIHIDPEVDSDLNRTLRILKEKFGSNLLEVYFYGSIPRGYKGLQSDIDLLAVVSDSQELAGAIGGFETASQLLRGKLGTYTGPSGQYPYRDIELHTIHQSKFKKSADLKLGEFLRNILDGAIKIY